MYKSAHEWPLDRTKRSRLNHFGFDGEYLITLLNKVCAIGAHPIGAPGCPLFAFCTISAPRQRIVLMQVVSTEVVIFCFFDGDSEEDIH